MEEPKKEEPRKEPEKEPEKGPEKGNGGKGAGDFAAKHKGIVYGVLGVGALIALYFGYQYYKANIAGSSAGTAPTSPDSGTGAGTGGGAPVPTQTPTPVPVGGGEGDLAAILAALEQGRQTVVDVVINPGGKTAVKPPAKQLSAETKSLDALNREVAVLAGLPTKGKTAAQIGQEVTHSAIAGSDKALMISASLPQTSTNGHAAAPIPHTVAAPIPAGVRKTEGGVSGGPAPKAAPKAAPKPAPKPAAKSIAKRPA